MDIEIPIIVEQLYAAMVTSPDPKFWPDYMKHDPVKGHGLWSFYRGVQLGVRLCTVCLGGH